ncbi:MAG: single-stranded DNA-binding protein [Clostridia bacterium]|nr:single-stranded DNA-binding protein [Clostridia bacterium]
MNSLDYNGVSLIGNIASISDIKTLPSGKKYKYFDLCQNIKYKDSFGEEKENKIFFSIRLFEDQIAKYDSIIKKGNWIHITGSLRNYLTENMEKKHYITVSYIREMKPKEKIEVFDYDWLNDPDSSFEEDYGL